MRKAKTGISGLDDVLSGGLSRGHIFLVEGEPGAGKTTVAVQFVLEGAKAGEQSLYITLSETEQELRQGASSHGWTLGSEIVVFELVPPESLLAEEQQQSLLYSYDLELRETTKQIVDAVERVKPSRVVQGCSTLFTEGHRKYGFETAESGGVAVLRDCVGLIEPENIVGEASNSREDARIFSNARCVFA